MLILHADNNIRCPSDSVMVPTNGMVSYSSPVENDSYIFGTVACSPGFGLSLETTTCTGENDADMGTFNGSDPTCDGKYPNGYIIIIITCANCRDHLPCSR